MRETVDSLRVYFIMVGAATIVSAAELRVSSLGFVRGLSVLACVLLAIATFVAGARMSTWLRTRVRLLYAIVSMQLLVQWLASVGDAMSGRLPSDSGAWVFWIRPLFALALGSYLAWNVRRLSLESAAITAADLHRP